MFAPAPDDVLVLDDGRRFMLLSYDGRWFTARAVDASTLLSGNTPLEYYGRGIWRPCRPTQSSDGRARNAP